MKYQIFHGEKSVLGENKALKNEYGVDGVIWGLNG